jgi:hypothetical protein
MFQVTGAALWEVLDTLAGIEDAFQAFDKWVNEQPYGYDELTLARNLFEVRFASVSLHQQLAANSAAIALGEERAKEIEEQVKKWVIESGFSSEEEYENY